MPWTTPGTAVAGAVLEASFWNSNVRDNLNTLSVWQSWTPTITNATIGNGTVDASYIQAGKTVLFSFCFTLGSTSAISGDFKFSLPVAQKQLGQMMAFYCTLYDSGIQTLPGSGFIPTTDNSSVIIRALNASGTYLTTSPLTASVPFTWSQNDIVTCSGVYVSA
jgi:hypothetical protein